jgi:hypothetical protein
MSELRQRYFRTLGLGANGTSSKLRLEAALARAYQLRNFEIEHYWKRATYFWGFQFAVFASFGLLWKVDSHDGEWRPIAVALAGLGILTGVANALSARGSRFWQENWEHHIDLLEDEIEGRLYKTVWLKDSKLGYSVSRINQCLSWYIVVFWAIIAFYDHGDMLVGRHTVGSLLFRSDQYMLVWC